jgi:hypothetical protein
LNKIGFIDYYLDEWHANQYVKWIHDPARGGKHQVSYAWAEIDRPGGISTADWCRNNNVQQAASIEELVEKCDSIVVLSPDNPEMHVSLSEIPLASGKPVYIDKTFALDVHSAAQMFDRAAKYHTPMYSTSALRYAVELAEYKGPGTLGKDIALVAAHGPGQFGNYSIHQIEMVVMSIGLGAKRAICTVSGNSPMVTYDYGDGRRSVVHCMPWAGFGLEVLAQNGEGASLSIEKDFWPSFIDNLLAFFDTKQPAVPKEETLEAVAMVETGLKAIENPDQWIAVEK